MVRKNDKPAVTAVAENISEPVLPVPAGMEENLQKARDLRKRLLAGLDVIHDPKQAGDPVRVKQLEIFYQTLEKEYRQVLCAAAIHPLDALCFPDCPNRGKGGPKEIGDEIILCECTCH